MQSCSRMVPIIPCTKVHVHDGGTCGYHYMTYMYKLNVPCHFFSVSHLSHFFLRAKKEKNSVYSYQVFDFMNPVLARYRY